MIHHALQDGYVPCTRPGLTRRAFTLIELLVVIALTVILFTLVFVPLINSLNLTSRAGTQIESQSAARDITRQLQTEMSAPVFVYDNAAQGETAGGPDGRVNIWLYGQGTNNNPINGSAYALPLRFGMIEFVEAASQSEQSGSGAVDPTTGKQIAGPTAPTNIALPLVPGRSIVRYFIGLRDNTSGVTGGSFPNMPVRIPNLASYSVNPNPTEVYHGYANRYDDAADVNANQDNRTTLFRAEVQPYILDPKNSGRYIPNVGLFHTMGGANANDVNGTLVLDDPNFFYDSTVVDPAYAVPGWVDLNKDGKVEMWENWAAVAQSQLALTKADAISLERDDNNAIVYRDNAGNVVTSGGFPVVRPLISFTPQYVENDPGIPASLEASGAETPYTAAAQFRTQYPAWTSPFRLMVYRLADSVYNNSPTSDPLSVPMPTFYEMDSSNNALFAQGVGANAGPQPDGSGFWQNTNPQFAFTVDADKGTVNFAFPHTVLDHDGSNPKPMYYNPSTINNNINPNVVTATGEPYGKRFLWLRYFDTTNTLNPTNGGGAVAISPLNQFYVDPTRNYTGCSIPPPPPPQYHVRIVPGSERVFGPDQNPGAHYGYRTQYTRVSANAGQIGRNQYRILYENGPNAACLSDANDPRVQTGYVEFDSLPDVDPGAPNPSNSPSPNLDPLLENPAGATPVYREHSLPLLKSSGGVNVAADPVEVSYSFQMNRPNDVVKVDYLTRSILNVGMELRLYDPRSGRPQTTQLTSKITVRNLPR